MTVVNTGSQMRRLRWITEISSVGEDVVDR